MNFVIEKNVPLPPIGNGRPLTELSAALRAMGVGDSLVVPNKTQTVVSNTLTRARKSTSLRFASRKVDGGVRVWRTA